LISIQFLEGYAVGSGQWVVIDMFILSLLWPWRKVLWDPEVRRKAMIMLGGDEDK
jgi:hypothetical protein